jgi:hypothetical protein
MIHKNKFRVIAVVFAGAKFFFAFFAVVADSMMLEKEGKVNKFLIAALHVNQRSNALR